MIITYFGHRKGHSHQKMGPEKDFYVGRQRIEEIERQPRIVVDFDKIEYLYD
jgi:hypothetical protein